MKSRPYVGTTGWGNCELSQRGESELVGWRVVALMAMARPRDDFNKLLQEDHSLAVKLLWSFLQNVTSRVRDLSAKVRDLNNKLADYENFVTRH